MATPLRRHADAPANERRWEPMYVRRAQRDDVPRWPALAAEVEVLFGALVDNPDFRRALHRNIERGTAFCVRENDGPPGAPVLSRARIPAGGASTRRSGRWLAPGSPPLRRVGQPENPRFTSALRAV